MEVYADIRLDAHVDGIVGTGTDAADDAGLDD